MGIPIRQEGIISTRRRRGIGSGEEGGACAFEPASPITVPRVTPAAQMLALAVLVDEIKGRANSP